MIEIVCLVILVIVLAVQEVGTDKFHVASCFFWIYAANVLFSSTELGAYIESINYYALQSLYSVVIILLLSLKISKLSLLIMCLEFVTIAVHGLGYWVDLQYDQTQLYWWLILLIYGIEVAAIISNRIVNGIYDGISKLGLLCRSSSILNKSDTGRNKGS